MSRPKSTPTYCIHKASGNAYATIDGAQRWFGKDGPDARAAYDRLIGEWLVGGRSLPAKGKADVLVAEIILAFWQHAQTYYVNQDGTPSGEADNYRYAMKPLRKLYGATPAPEFGPKALRVVRDAMITAGLCRNVVNRQTARLKQVFKWAASNELVPASVYHGLATVGGLRKGKSAAKESKPVRAVPDPAVNAVLPFLSPQVDAMVRLQRITGARQGELFVMRTCDIDTTRPVWLYIPSRHKESHLDDGNREIRFGPQAQEVLQPMLKTDVQALIFSPAEAEEWRAEQRREKRQTRVQPSQVKRAERARKRGRDRAPRDRYDRHSYARAISRACDQAFPPPAPLAQREDETRDEWHKRLTPDQKKELKAWQKSHRWHPHQLRHNAATTVRREYGIEASRMVLGHRMGSAITEQYAEADGAKVDKIMGEVG